MFEADSERIDRTATKVRVCWHGAAIPFASALELLRTDHAFRSQLVSTLAASPFAAFFWETPPATMTSLARPFEFVLTDAPGLANASPDVNAFREHFNSDDDRNAGVVVFDNLGRDATLVVPCPRVSTEVYVHLAAFLRGAPEAQKHALLERMANEVLSRVSARPLWLSTAGMGVYWLHVRLDSRPKYYRHAPYKSLA
jgi:hypothetical protein